MSTDGKTSRQTPGTDTAVESALDPYQILGVPENASYEMIRRSYRAMAKLCHPDLGNEPDREEKFKRLNWAYNRVLEGHRLREQAKKVAVPEETPAASSSNEATGTDARVIVNHVVDQGRSYLIQGNVREAERLARFALEMARDSTAAYTLLGDALAIQARYSEAVGCLLLALQIDRDYVPARTALERLQERQRNA